MINAEIDVVHKTFKLFLQLLVWSRQERDKEISTCFIDLQL